MTPKEPGADEDLMAGLQPGETLEVAMLSPCVGGLVRTWTDASSRLWSVPDPTTLQSYLGRGLIARTLREEGRYREVGMLHEPSGLLMLQSRFPTSTTDDTRQVLAAPLRLSEPGSPSASTRADLLDLLAGAVRHTLEADGFLVVERGGWEAPPEPYCLFIVIPEHGGTSVIEAAPAPVGAALWESSIRPGAAGATLSAPATPESISVVPTLMLDAVSTWGLEPWDIALTYGRRT